MGAIAIGCAVFIPNKDFSSTNDQDDSHSGAPVVECKGKLMNNLCYVGLSAQSNIKSKRR